VLDRLERADRAAELAADPGVAGRGLAAPGGHPGGFGGEQGGGQVADARRVQAGPQALRRDDGVELDGNKLAGEVDRGEPGDGDAWPVLAEQEPDVTVGCGRRGEQRAAAQVRRARQQRAGPAGDAERTVRLAGSGQRARGERDRGRAARQAAAQDGRQHRARGQGEGQLLERGSQVGHGAVAGDGEDAEAVQVVHQPSDPVGRLPRSQQSRVLRADQGDRPGPLRPVAERRLQRLLLLRHRDRQGPLPSV